MKLTPGLDGPTVGDLVRCARCSAAYTVVHDAGAGASFITLVPVAVAASERIADAESSCCPACATADERHTGVTFSRACCSETPSSCALCAGATCQRCRRCVRSSSEERRTGAVACRACDPENLFAIGRPAVFLVIEDDYDYHVVRSVWTTRDAADNALARLKAAHPDRWFKVDGEILRSPEDGQR